MTRSSDRMRTTNRSGLEDVSELISTKLMYSSRPTKSIGKRYKTFTNACQLRGFNERDIIVMYLRTQTTFLKKQELLHFVDTVLYESASPEDAIRMLEFHFLDVRAKCVNDGICMDLKLGSVKLGRSCRSQNICNKTVFTAFLTQILDLSNICTGSGVRSEVIANQMAAIRGMGIFATVYRSPPKRLLAQNSLLRSCSLEADRPSLKGNADVKNFTVAHSNEIDLHETAENLVEAFFVYRRFRKTEEDSSGTSKRYGDAYQKIRFGRPLAVSAKQELP